MGDGFDIFVLAKDPTQILRCSEKISFIRYSLNPKRLELVKVRLARALNMTDFASLCPSFIGRANLGSSYEFAFASGICHFPLLSTVVFPAVQLG